MIDFQEAMTLHEGLSYDSMYTPRASLKATIDQLASAIDQAMTLLEKTELIVLPWQHAMPFQRQWQTVPGIKSVRHKADALWNTPWLWGHTITYKDVDCLASSLAQSVIVSGVRDLRKAYGPEDRVVLIEIEG